MVRNNLPSMHIYCKRKEGGLEKLAVREIPPHRRIWKHFKRTPGIIFAYILQRARLISPPWFQCAFRWEENYFQDPCMFRFIIVSNFWSLVPIPLGMGCLFYSQSFFLPCSVGCFLIVVETSSNCSFMQIF